MISSDTNCKFILLPNKKSRIGSKLTKFPLKRVIYLSSEVYVYNKNSFVEVMFNAWENKIIYVNCFLLLFKSYRVYMAERNGKKGVFDAGLTASLSSQCLRERVLTGFYYNTRLVCISVLGSVCILVYISGTFFIISYKTNILCIDQDESACWHVSYKQD